jgi:hypothetical protein
LTGQKGAPFQRYHCVYQDIGRGPLRIATMLVMYKILTSGDVNTFEVVFTTSGGEALR